MMDETALFRLTYGLYVAGVAFGGKKNACIVNTVQQATTDPARLLVTMQHDTLTTELAKKKGSLSFAVLDQSCPMEWIQALGARSGRDCDKFADLPHGEDTAGNPYPLDHTTARLSMLIDTTLDLGDHLLFAGRLTEALRTGEGAPLTYADYHARKVGRAPLTRPDAQPTPSYICTVCHYIYDGETPFDELPDDWVCPVCKKGKDVFVKNG